MGGAIGVYRWELRKLVSQKRTYLGLAAATLVPLIFTIALTLQKGQPNDVAFGRYVRESGLAIPLVLLLFGSIWLFPLITALVAGDIIASEHHNGTLKTILTRSLDRGQIFAGKVMTAFTYAFIALLVMGTTAVVAGTIKSGFNPLVTLSGTKVSATKALGLVAASFAVYLLPLFAIACFGLFLSALTRNSAAAVMFDAPRGFGTRRDSTSSNVLLPQPFSGELTNSRGNTGHASKACTATSHSATAPASAAPNTTYRWITAASSAISAAPSTGSGHGSGSGRSSGRPWPGAPAGLPRCFATS